MKHLFVPVIWLMAATGPVAHGQGVAVGTTPLQGASPQPAVGRRPVYKPVVMPAPAGKVHPGRVANANPTASANANTAATATANAKVKPVRPPVIAYDEARRRFRHERHDRFWWNNHYRTIVFVLGGYYYWDAGYWFPAWGYDTAYNNYDYDGPIFTYGNLLPDQVIVNVQNALQQLGYYSGPVTGSLGPSSRAALVAYQQDTGLVVTGAIDAPTVEALGLY